jgi:hypothetical protein
MIVSRDYVQLASRREADVVNLGSLLVLLLLYTVPVLILWAVIYSAVLAALRRHNRDNALSR